MSAAPLGSLVQAARSVRAVVIYSVVALLSGCSSQADPASGHTSTPKQTSSAASPTPTATGPVEVCTSARQPFPQRLVEAEKYGR